jgi:inhibitor of KinA
MEAGSVAIGGAQTGIYPNESPGGWHVIGRTPISLFNPEANPPVFAKPGERIKFIPIDLEEYDQQSQNSTFPTSHD